MVRDGKGTQWVVYIRRSYKEANAADVSDTVQTALASALVPDGIAPLVISDSGGHQSGRSDQRDGYQQLLTMLRAGLVAGVCVYDLSRLARNAKTMLNLKSELDQRQVQLRVAMLPSSQFDGATGRFMFGQFCLAAEYQANVDSERMSSMLRGIYENGGHRGHAPLGYRSARKADGELVRPRTLEVIPEEAAVVRTVWTSLRTKSLVELTGWLNAHGVQRRTKLPWTAEATKDIWRRGLFYTGRVVLHRGMDDRPGTHEAIITTTEYRQTVAAVASRRRSGPKPKPYRNYLLRGLLYCACGRRMRGEARVQRGGERRYYRCPGPCSACLLAAEPAEVAVLDTMSKAVLPAPTVDAARDELRRRLSTPGERSAREKRPQLEARLERLRKQHEWGDLNDAEYRAKRAELQGELSQLAEGNKVILFDRNRQVMTRMAQNISAATAEQRGELARLLIERAVATDGVVEIEWSGPARPFFDHVGGWCPQGDSNP